jgi:D-alanyl-D-alanine carboxypeptidase
MNQESEINNFVIRFASVNGTGSASAKIVRRSILISTVVAVFVLGVPGQGNPGKRIDSLVAQKMAANHIPGLSLAVMRGGKVLFAKGYGLSNLELSTPTTEKTSFAIFSITKTFTAVAVMMLVEEGKISIDKPITDYLQDLPGSWSRVTIRHLLTHTSGLPELCDAAAKPCDRRDHYTQSQVIGLVRESPFLFEPGTRWEYSNTGFFVLGMLIEKMSGKTYGDFLKARIFTPLGMDRTRMDDYSAVIPNRASGYTWENGAYSNALRVSPTLMFSLAGIISTVADLAKYDAALYGEKLLQRTTLKEMWTKVVLNDGATANQGLGFGMTPFKGHRRVGHSGGHAGFATTITRLIDDKVSVVILSTSDTEGYAKDSGGFLISDIANEIASYYFKK